MSRGEGPGVKGPLRRIGGALRSRPNRPARWRLSPTMASSTCFSTCHGRRTSRVRADWCADAGAIVSRVIGSAAGTRCASIFMRRGCARTLIEEQEALNPGAPRLIYGRGTREPIKQYETAMNAAALGLLHKNARLVSWDGARRSRLGRLWMRPRSWSARALCSEGVATDVCVRAFCWTHLRQSMVRSLSDGASCV